MPHSNEDMVAFGRDLAGFAAQQGVTLTTQDADAIYQQVVARGEFHPLGVQNALASFAAHHADPGEFGEDFEYESEPEEDPNLARSIIDDFIEPVAEEAASRAGRPLTLREQGAIWDATHAQAELGALDADRIAANSGVKSWEGMSRAEQAQTMAERVRDQQPADDDEDRVFDIQGSSRDFVDYAVQRMQGQEFSDVGYEQDWGDED